jgi:hypothetical protein
MKRIPAWWRWSFLMLASLVFAYSQGWSRASLIPLGIFCVIGFARIFFATVMRIMSRNLATMSPKTREKVLAGMSEEKKRKLLAEYGIQEEAPPEKIREAVNTLERFARSIMCDYGEQNFQGDTQAKQILSVYCFGAVSAFATQHGLIPAQAHAVCLTLFTKVFGFAADDAAAKAQAVITAAPDRTSHLYAIIHRGADAYMYWQQHGDDRAAKDFAEIMEKVKNA